MMFKKIFILSFLICASGYAQESITDRLQALVDSLKAVHCPDRRETVFDITFKADSAGIILKGEVMDETARDQLFSGAKALGAGPVNNLIRVLPDSTAREIPWGIIRLSAAQVRAAPSNLSEMVSQNIMGAEVRILKSGANSFYYCQMEDNYLGWIKESAMVMGGQAFIDEWRNAERAVVLTLFCQAFEEPSEESDPVTDLVQGNTIILEKSLGKWTQIRLPDGRQGYVRSANILPEKEQRKKFGAEVQSMIQLSKSVLGVPYLWGGSSVKGFDCSGFVQHFYKFHGIQLPRDASLQARVGEEVKFSGDLTVIQPGDLLFFGSNPQRITHVGMAIDSYRFIHASEWVKINSFDPDAKDYSAYLHERLRAVRRFIHSGKN